MYTVQARSKICPCVPPCTPPAGRLQLEHSIQRVSQVYFYERSSCSLVFVSVQLQAQVLLNAQVQLGFSFRLRISSRLGFNSRLRNRSIVRFAEKVKVTAVTVYQRFRDEVRILILSLQLLGEIERIKMCVQILTRTNIVHRSEDVIDLVQAING